MNNLLSHDEVIKLPPPQRFWEMKYGKQVAFCFLLGLLFGLTEIMLDPRLETTDVTLRKAAQAIAKDQMGTAERLLSIAGHRKLFMYQEAWFKKNRGDYFKKKGNRGQAIKAYTEAKNCSIVGYSLDARNAMASLYREEKQYNEAVQAYNALLPLLPAWDVDRNVWIRIMLGDVYLEWGKYADAVRVYESIEKVNGVREEQVIESKIKMAGLKGQMGDRKEEIRLYETLLTSSLVNKAQHGLILWMEGNAYRAIGDKDKAKERYEEGIRWSNEWYGLAPRSAVADMYLEDKKFEEAIREYAKILEMSSHATEDLVASARLGMGDAYSELGKYLDARRQYESVKTINGVRSAWVVAARERITDLKRRMDAHEQ